MQLLSCHVGHKEGKHLAPHWVLAVGTSLGTEERKIIEGSGGAEQDIGTLCFRLATQWEPSQPLPRGQTLTLCHLGDT